MSIVLFSNRDPSLHLLFNNNNEIQYYPEWIYDNIDILNEINIIPFSFYNSLSQYNQLGVFNLFEDKVNEITIIPFSFYNYFDNINEIQYYPEWLIDIVENVNEIQYYPEWIRDLHLLYNSWYIFKLFEIINGEGVLHKIVTGYQTASGFSGKVTALGISLASYLINALIIQAEHVLDMSEYKKNFVDKVNELQEVFADIHQIVNVITYNDPIEKSQEIINALGLNNNQQLANSFHTVIYALHVILNGILPFNVIEKQDIINQIKDHISRFEEIFTGIDPIDLISLQEIANQIVDAGLTEYHDIINMIGSLCRVIEHDVKVYIDGNDFSNKVQSGSIKMMSNENILSEFDITLYGDDFFDANVINIEILGDQYEFLAEEFDIDVNNKTIKLWGRSTLAEFHTPFETKRSYTFNKKLVSEIIEELLPGVVKEFKIYDSYVNFVTEDTPLGAFKKLLKEIGAVAHYLPNNVLYIIYPNYYENMSELQDMIKLRKAKKLYQYNSITVNYGGKLGFIQIESEKTSVSVNEMVDVRVYTLNPDYTFYTEADYYAKVGERIVEVVEEDISINREWHKFSLSYPVKHLIEYPDWVEFNEEENAFYIDESKYCNVIHVKYETVYDLYRTTNYDAEKIMYCTAATGYSFTKSIGDGKINNTIESSIILDNVTAEHKVDYELFNTVYNIELQVENLYDAGLNVGNGFVYMIKNKDYIMTDYEINFNSNPVFVTSKYILRGKE